MARTKSIKNGVKYTVVLPEETIEQLKELANKKVIVSINAGVREAVADYIIQQKKEQYKQDLSEAVKDPSFIQRTKDAMDDFRSLDQELEGTEKKW